LYIIQSELVLRNEHGHRHHPGIPLLPRDVIRRHVDLDHVGSGPHEFPPHVQIRDRGSPVHLLQPEKLGIPFSESELVELPPSPRLHLDPEELPGVGQLRGDVDEVALDAHWVVLALPVLPLFLPELLAPPAARVGRHLPLAELVSPGHVLVEYR